MKTALRQITLADTLILLAALLWIISVYAHFWGSKGHYATLQALVLIEGENAPLRVDLRQNRMLHVHGRLGESILEIRDGKIRFISSPCANKQCIRTGWLTRGGDIAACLPNRVTVQIEEDSAEGFDALVF